MIAPHPPRARSRRGSALLLVLATTTLALSAWGAANRRTADLLRLKDAHARRLHSDGSDGPLRLNAVATTPDASFDASAPLRAAALGLVPLSAADPPQQLDDQGAPRPYSAFQVSVSTSTGPAAFVLKFTPDAGRTRWTIAAIPAADWEADPANEPTLDEVPDLPRGF